MKGLLFISLTLVTAALSSAHSQSVSPDGSILIKNLTTSDGTWTLGPPFDTLGNWYINLNDQPAAGAAGSKLVVANGGKLYALGTDSNWYVWANSHWSPSSDPLEPPTVVLRVGPSDQYKTVSAAINVANADQDLGTEYDIQIAPGTYRNDFAEIFRQLTLEPAPGAAPGSVILEATVPPSNGKAIIVAWADLTVRGITFTGAVNSSNNGAGIRDHNLTPNGRLAIENSTFTGNQTGVLTDPRANSLVITITGSNFINNGVPAIRNPHALYVNGGASLTVSDSLFCGQLRGHDIKSRAQATTVTGNQLYDGAANAALGCNAGTTSLAIDIANGGKAVISGNAIIQGPASPNFAMVSYGAEGLAYPDNSLVVSNNIFSNTAPTATAIQDPHCVIAQLSNNTFINIPRIVNPPGCAVGQ